MSFLTVPFSRLKNTPNLNETTEMTQITNLDSFMALMDGRKILDNHESDDDDNSSLSSDNTDYMTELQQQKEQQTGVKYNYNEDDDDNTNSGVDEAEQSLVGNDLEGGISIKKVCFLCIYVYIY